MANDENSTGTMSPPAAGRLLRAVTKLEMPWLFLRNTISSKVIWLTENQPRIPTYSGPEVKYTMYVPRPPTEYNNSTVIRNDQLQHFFGYARQILDAITRNSVYSGYTLALDFDIARGEPTYGNSTTASNNMLGRLQRGEVDIVAYDVLSHLGTRINDFALTQPVALDRNFVITASDDVWYDLSKYDETITYAERMSKAWVDPIDFFGLTRPYQVSTWIVLGICMTICTFLLVTLDWSGLRMAMLQRKYFKSPAEIRYDEEARIRAAAAAAETATMAAAAAARRAERTRVHFDTPMSRADDNDDDDKNSKNWRPHMVALQHIESLSRFVITQDTPFTPPSTTSHLMLMFWALFCTIFVTVYPSELFSRMVVPGDPPPPFWDFVDMRSKSYRLIGVKNDHMGAVVKELLRDMEHTSNGYALKKMLLPEDQWPTSYEELWESIRTNTLKGKWSWYRLATIHGKSFAPGRMVGGRCDLHAVEVKYDTYWGVKKTLPDIYSGLAVRKNDTALFRHVQHRLARMRSGGLFQALRHQAHTWKNAKANVKNGTLWCHVEQLDILEGVGDPVSLKSMTSSYLMVLLAAILGAISCVFEQLIINDEEKARQDWEDEKRRRRSRRGGGGGGGTGSVSRDVHVVRDKRTRVMHVDDGGNRWPVGDTDFKPQAGQRTGRAMRAWMSDNDAPPIYEKRGGDLRSRRPLRRCNCHCHKLQSESFESC